MKLLQNFILQKSICTAINTVLKLFHELIYNEASAYVALVANATVVGYNKQPRQGRKTSNAGSLRIFIWRYSSAKASA